MANWRATWSGGTAYAAGDSVTYSGVTYYCVTANTGHTPGTDADWALLDSFTGPAASNVVDNVTVTGTPASGQTITATSASAATWQTPASGVTLDATAGDIKALGSQSAGSGTSAARGDHVHPSTGVVLTSSLPLALGSGGTGQASAAAAITALTGSQTSGKVLRSDGTSAALASLQAADVPTLNQNSTGTAGGLSATLAIGSGGTSATSAGAALTSLGAASAAALTTETSRAEAAEALLAPLAGPALTGAPTAPTATALTSTTQLATTAYADSATGAEKTRALAAEALLAPLASAALTGSPTAPTQSAGDNSTKIATDAFATAAVLAAEPAFLPSDTAAPYLAWAFDPGAIGGQATWTAGLIQLIRVNVRQAITTCTGVIAAIGVAGGTLTNCFAGLYSSAGAILGTSADQSTIWTTAGVYSCAFGGGAISLSAGFYWVGYVVATATTIPSFSRIGAPPTPLIPNAGFTASTARWATASGTLHTSLTSFTPSASTLTASEYWAAIY